MILIWFAFVAIFNFSPVDLLSKALSRNKPTDKFIPCDEGWFFFREKCLKLRGVTWNQMLSWDRAEAVCNGDGGHLVTIQSKEEQDYIFHFLLLDTSRFVWIGFRKQGNSTYVWRDGTAVNYTYWGQGQPSKRENEDCVAMSFYPVVGVLSGEWYSARCDLGTDYVCQKGIDRRKKSQDPLFCTSEEGGGWKFRNTCYHVVMERKTWDKAEQHCKSHYGGHLATILDKAVDIFLDNIFSTLGTELWIGITISDELQQKWASGWFVTYYSGWFVTRSTDFSEVIDDTCVLTNKTEWTMAPCSEKYPFICDTIRDPPVLKQPVNGSHCPETPPDWIDLGGEYCYFFEREIFFSWYEANYECRRRGGNLASIHSKEETEMLSPFIKYSRGQKKIGLWIGLLRQLVPENSFIWTDDSPIDYDNWRTRQHRDNPDEICGMISTMYMDWSGAWCREKTGYICSIRKVTPNVTKTLENVGYNCPVSYSILIGVSVSMLLVFTLVQVAVYWFRSKKRQTNNRKASTTAAISQNALSTNGLIIRSQTDVEGIAKAPQHGEHLYEEPQYIERHYE